MSVTIIIPTALRQYAGGISELSVEARTAGEALDQVTTDLHADLVLDEQTPLPEALDRLRRLLVS